MLNCIIVDDQQFSVDVILKYAKLLPRLNIIEIYLNPKHALENYALHDDIDIIFMDIDMPQISGIELATVMRTHTKKLIFTTSHSMYAFDAYQVEGDAFLLKPFSLAKFTATINRLFPWDHLKNDFRQPDQAPHFLIKNKDEDLRIVKVNYEDIIAFESINNYVKIHVSNGKAITGYLNLKDVSELVKNRREFKQFHRAFIISTIHVSYIEANTVFLNNDIYFKVGSKFKRSFGVYISHNLIRTTRNIK
jgi:DNA-binding LytR/AlgR family response regulator